jgi:hypothetical protein
MKSLKETKRISPGCSRGLTPCAWRGVSGSLTCRINSTQASGSGWGVARKPPNLGLCLSSMGKGVDYRTSFRGLRACIRPFLGAAEVAAAAVDFMAAAGFSSTAGGSHCEGNRSVPTSRRVSVASPFCRLQHSCSNLLCSACKTMRMGIIVAAAVLPVRKIVTD